MALECHFFRLFLVLRCGDILDLFSTHWNYPFNGCNYYTAFTPIVYVAVTAVLHMLGRRDHLVCNLSRFYYKTPPQVVCLYTR